MNAIEQSQAELIPKMEALITHLGQMNDFMAHGFFTEIYGLLGTASEEDELLEVCLALSTSAFQGFQFDPTAAVLLDDLLAHAEQIAFTFSASKNSVN